MENGHLNIVFVRQDDQVIIGGRGLPVMAWAVCGDMRVA